MNGHAWFILTSVVSVGVVVGACIVDLFYNKRVVYPRAYTVTRFKTWLLMGLSYALLFFGRYNFAAINSDVCLNDLKVTPHQFGYIATAGLWCYAISILVNGAVCDNIGSKPSMVIGTLGSSLCNGLFYYLFTTKIAWIQVNFWAVLVLNGLNNYFQSFGSLAIVKVGSIWYHQKERGLFGGIFGCIVGFGFFLALSLNQFIASFDMMHNWPQTFMYPSIALIIICAINALFLKPRPVDAGFEPIPGTVEKKSDAGFFDAARFIFKKPIFYVFIFVEITLGWCRDGIIYWYSHWLENLEENMVGSEGASFLASFLVTMGGMFGSLLSGIVSDLVFNSRRQPVAFIGMIGYLINLVFMYWANAVLNPWTGAIAVGLASFFFSSVHGIVTSTCAMDFSTTASVGVAVGLLDGTQKFGSGLQGLFLGGVIGNDKTGYHYDHWIFALAPSALICAVLLLSIINKKAPEQKDKEDEPLMLTVEEDDE
ncbi:hypothetical protein PCE1_000612 [Barthelona sp. PCE]